MTKKTSKLTTEHRARVTRNIDQAFDLIGNVMQKPEEYPASFVVLPLDPDVLSRVFTVERVRLFQELRRAGHVESLEPVYGLKRPVLADLRAVERADKELEQHHADEAFAHRLLREALTRNAFGTASIEGNPLTLADVESLLALAPTPGRVTEPDEREILNYAAFMRDIDSVRVPRKPLDVCALHKLLFNGVLKQPGRFKDKLNFVGRKDTREVVYVPTLPEHVEDELAAALDWLHAADEHPLVRAAVFFHEFQSIHPFGDGNGRLGRALTALILWHEGYRGVQYALVDYAFNEGRDAYYSMLDEARQSDWDLTPWVAYMSGVFRATFESAVQRFLFRGELPAELNDRQVRVAEWFARLDRGNPGRRQKFNDVHAGFPHVARRTLQLDLAKLVNAGVLRREGERKGSTYRYVAKRKRRY